jgi:Uma2 family endonuclease
MSTPTVRTAEELLQLREPGRHELVRGELHRMSPAGFWHGAVTWLVGQALGAHVQRQRLGMLFGAETGFVLARNPDTVLAPAVAFVSWSRMPAAFQPGFFPGPPDLAIEVVSPDDSVRQMQKKAGSWLAHGTRTVWGVDPESRTVVIHGTARASRSLGIDATLNGGDVVPGFTVAVCDLFPVRPRN